MWRSLIDKFNRKGRKQGYTMTELLAVLGIIAVVVAIAIPSIFFISRALKFKQRNDYAKTIFLAAQANLSEMRSDGRLDKLQSDSDAESVPLGHCGFPDEEWSYEYEYTSSEFPEPGAGIWSSYDLVLPENSVEGTLRSGNVIIEYNPVTGNVFSVFYCDDEILSQYRDAGTLPRNDEEKDDEKKRKEMMLGYYDGSGLSSSKLDLEITKAALEFDPEGEEGILTVKVPVPESYYAHLNEFMNGLTVKLTLVGDTSHNMITPIYVDMSTGKVDVDGKTVKQEFLLDSLADYSSFANLVAAPTVKANGDVEDNTGKHITDYMDESEFTLLPGENITVHVEVDFEGEREVEVKGASLPGINPMFQSLEANAVGDGNGYVVTVSNGRHLQNLNALAPLIANDVYSLLFTDDIYWNETVEYYNNKYNAGNVYENDPAENPCRGLPYFVPIHNENLFGTATFEYPDENAAEGTLWHLIVNVVESIFGSSSDITVAFKGNEDVPTLTDAMDGKTVPDSTKTIAQHHAEIQGENHKVYYLNIDSTKYIVPNINKDPVNKNGVLVNPAGTFYATGTRQIVDYYFTGLFGYVNTRVENLHVVNPIIKGKNFVDEQSKQVPIWGLGWNGILPSYTIVGYRNIPVYSNPATGALIGAAGYNTVVSNCSVYIDTKDPDFNRSYMGHRDYDSATAQDWYGVSGAGAVGGLIGYAKSHRTTSEELSAGSNHLAFENSFAAVNVSGKMRGDEKKHYGYSNGVGGFIGNSQLTNFFNCYSSGDVKASGLYITEDKSGTGGGWEAFLNWVQGLLGTPLDLPYNGRVSIGAGGFVGTSHGTRYSKCFTTGSVAGTGTKGGVGGFVGVMSMDENFSYGNDSGDTTIAQTTHMTECYAVGRTTFKATGSSKTQATERFSGANARVNFSTSQTDTYITNDYYRLFAAVRIEEGREPKMVDTYIFRDSYYLSEDRNADQTNSNSCSTPELYSTFKDLQKAHKDDESAQDETWRQSKIETIKEISLKRITLSWPFYENTNYRKKYFESNKGKEINLEGLYHQKYSEGYQEDWGPATEQTTHSYSLNAAGAKYPFTKLENLEYYGDWPSTPSNVGLAYYETYLEANGKETVKRYYYDRDSTSELYENEDTMVISDGYAVLTATEGTIKVKVGDDENAKLINLTGQKQGSKFDPDDTLYSENIAYHVYLLNDEVMEAAMEESRNGKFYVKLTIIDPTNAEYVTYFNPAVALTQVNPVEGNTATKPSTIPSQLYIRSARQFAALGKNQYLWGEEFNYVQQFNIDAEVYKWTKASDAQITSIGTTAHPFEGTYRGNGGYVTQAQISGFEPTVGFFDTVDSTAEIKNLVINLEDLTIDAGKAENAGILAHVNGGTIDNVDLNLTGTTTVKAKTDAGLLVGRNVASSKDEDTLYPAAVSNCDVHAETVAVNAANAGGLIGEAVGQSLDNLTTITGNNVEFTNMTSTGGMVGGMVGVADKAKFQNSSVTTVLNADNALYAGGFAGACYDSEVMTLVVNLSGASTAQDNLAGLVGAAYTSDFTAADVQLAAAASMTADVAAGAFGEASQVNVKNSAIFLPGAINGTTGAAGFAHEIGKDSLIQLANVTLTNGSVTATDGNAAGYAVEIAGTVANSAVKLGTKQSGAASISGKTQAVGFGGTVSGDISSCSVAGRGAITASEGNAAGFAGAVSGTIGTSYATPATSNTDYIENGNYNLTVSGTSTAGFALSLDNKATISGSYILCQLTNSTGGFAGVNEGSISECTANVTQTGAAAFVGDNSGKVNNCYGWYGDNTTTDASDAFGTNTGRVTSSYFANIDAPEGLAELYDYKGTCTQVAPGMITVDDLNTATYHGWAVGEDDPYYSYPYKANLKPGYYPYPRLNNHYGNWVREAQYAYGVIYYEQYSDDSWSYRVVELSDPNETVDKQSMSTKSVDLRGNDVSIEKVGYALFYHAEKCPFDEAILDKNLFAEENPFAEALGSRYEVAGLIAKKPMEFKSQVKTADGDMMVEVIPFFADAIDAAEYQVRTPEQLSHVDEYSGETFLQTHTIEVNTLEKINTFSGSYTAKDNSDLIVNSAPAGWMDNVTGTVELGRLTVDEFAAPIFGTISKNVKVSELTTKDAASKLVNKITGGKIILNEVSVGNSTLDTLVGEISGGTVTMGTVTVSGEVTGSLIGKISGGTTTVDKVTVGGAAEGTLVGSVTGGTTTLTNVTVDGKTVGTLFGAITGGTLKGETITISGAITDNLFASVASQATLSDFTVTANGVDASLIGTVGGTVKDIDLVCKAESYLIGSGILTNAVTGGTIEDCDVTMGIVNADLNSFLALNTEKTQLAFGGIAAQLPGAVTFKNNTVEAVINVTGADDKLAVIGGMVGYSAANITGGSSNVTVNYTQTEKDQVGIGGLAAWSEKGITISGTKDTHIQVAGQINLNGSGYGRSNYYIGGAIAYDAGATYQYITSGVAVDTDWKGCVSGIEEPATNPSGAGNVGMFVGRVQKGTFKNCSSTAENGTYQFLGEIAYTAQTLGKPSYGSWFSYATGNSNLEKVLETSNQLKNVAKKAEYEDRAEGYAYVTYAAQLSDCTFMHGMGDDAQVYTQQIDVNEYFYLGKEETVPGGKKLTEAAPISNTTTWTEYTKQSSVKYSQVYNGTTSTQVETNYYTQVNGSYYKVLVTVSESSEWWTTYYTYTFYANGQRVTSRKISDRDSTVSGITLYTLTEKSETTITMDTTKSYVITDSTGLNAFNGTKDKVVLSKDSSGVVSADTNLVLWTVDSNGAWKQDGTNNYLYLNYSTQFVGTTAQKITITSVNGGHTLKGVRYLTFINNEFGTNRDTGSALKFWTVTPIADKYKYTITYQNKTTAGQDCTAVGPNGETWEPVEIVEIMAMEETMIVEENMIVEEAVAEVPAAVTGVPNAEVVKAAESKSNAFVSWLNRRLAK